MLTPTRALVTGAGVRLGRAIALALARYGLDVAVHYGHSRQEALETAARIEGFGRRAVVLGSDLRQPQAPATLIDDAWSELGGLEVLVNSAAMFLPGSLAEASVADFDDQMAVNLRAPFFLAQRFAERLGSQGCGVVVNVGDARNNRPGIDHAAYRLTKVALEALTRNLAIDLAPRVRVVMVSPGAILPAPGEGPERLEQLARERVPLRRPGTPDQVASSVVHLIENTFLTGVVLPVDGGEWI